MTGILLFVPMYNCEKQIGRVLHSLRPFQEMFDEVLIVDNRSKDGSINAAKAAMGELNQVTVTLIQNDTNYHFGGSHKIAFDYALKTNREHVLILHGDDQADIHDLVPLLTSGEHTKVDLLLGARFHAKSRLVGYSKFRTYGNILVNAMASIVSGHRIYDTGAGLNVYSKWVYLNRDYLTFPDDLTFSTCLLFYCMRKKQRLKFFPLTWREEDQVSNAKVIRQGIRIGIVMLRYACRMKRFIPVVKVQPYTYTVVQQSVAR